jgi:small subunit ribosomal protein S6
MRIYEELFIVKPDAPEEEVEGFVEQLRGQLTTAGATVDKVEKWGKRKLAYKVDKYREGSYVLFQFSAGAETVKELERRLRVSDVVLKFLTVRIDQTLKRLEKRKKARDKRAAKRAERPAAAPMPGAAAPVIPEAPAQPTPGLPPRPAKPSVAEDSGVPKEG